MCPLLGWWHTQVSSAVSDTPQEICCLSVKIHWWWLSCSKQVSSWSLFIQRTSDKRQFKSWWIRDSQNGIPVTHVVLRAIQCSTLIMFYLSHMCNTALLCVTVSGWYVAVNLSDIGIIRRKWRESVGSLTWEFEFEWILETNNWSRLRLSLVLMLQWFDQFECSPLSSCYHVKLLKQHFSSAVLQTVALHATQVHPVFPGGGQVGRSIVMHTWTIGLLITVFCALQHSVTSLRKLLLHWIVLPEMLEHMASTWNHEKTQISSGLKWSRPSGRIRRNKLGYYSGLAVLPNDVAIAWGTGASVGKAKKNKKKARRVGADTKLEWLQLSVFFCFFFDGRVGWLQPMRCYDMDLSYSGRPAPSDCVLLIVFPCGPWR